jgi:hypothetical protein
MIGAYHFANQFKVDQNKQELDAYYDTNDLNKDGYVDFWEESSSPQMRANLEAYSYPWKKVYGPDAIGARLKFMVDREIFFALAQQDNFHKFFNFPSLMQDLITKLSDPQSLRQLIRVFVSQDNDIVYVVHQFTHVPEGGFTNEYFAKLKDPKASKEAGFVKIEPTQVMVGLENMGKAKIDSMMGLSNQTHHIEDFQMKTGPPPKKTKTKKKK